MKGIKALEGLSFALKDKWQEKVICKSENKKLTIAELLEIVYKDLEILECFRKIPKQDLKDFIEWQIRYEKNMKTWLEERHFCYIGKEEEYTKHLIKIKEWVENDSDQRND